MKRVLVLLSFLGFFAYAEIEPEAQELLERAREAHGGEALAGLLSLRETSILTYYGSGGEPVAELRAVNLMDLETERLRLELFDGETLAQIHQLNTEGGVSWTAQTGAVALPAAQERELRQVFLFSYYGLRRGGEGREEAILEGEKTFNETTGQALRVTTQGMSTLYLLGEDGRLLAERFMTSQLGEVTVFYDDYREVDDILLPFSSRQYAGGMLVASTGTLEASVNVPVSEDDFALP